MVSFDIKVLEEMSNKLGEYISKAYFIPELGLAIYALVGGYTGFGKETYELINSWNFYILYNLAILLLAYPFIVNFLKFRKLLEGRLKAYRIKMLLVNETQL